jgi:erythromycin esterase-like protein
MIINKIEDSKKYNNGKVIIIAHNDHIQKGIVLSEVKNRQLGYLLDIEYKEKYYNIGFEFSRGTFYSKDINDNYKLKIFHVDKNIKNDLAARLFEKTNIPMFFLDLKAAAQNSRNFLDFISLINRYNSIGAVYDDKKYDFGVDDLILKDMYDAILYIRNSNNTTPLSV